MRLRKPTHPSAVAKLPQRTPRVNAVWIIAQLSLTLGMALLLYTLGLTRTAAGQSPPADDAAAAVDEPSAVTESPRPSGEATRSAAADTPLAYMRRLLPVGQLDESHLDKLYDGHPIDANETETLLTVLFVVPELPPLKLREWTQATRPFGVSDLERSPELFRTQVFSMSGRVRRVDRETPVAELQEQFEIEAYYRCQVTLEDGASATVYARTVPAAWLQNERPQGETDEDRLDERVSFQGVFLKNAGDAGGPAMPVFVASRLAWHPDTFLGDLGVDVGLLDAVRFSGRITAPEGEAFHQLMAAMQRTSVAEVQRAAEAAFDLPGVKPTGEHASHNQFNVTRVTQFGLKADVLQRHLRFAAELRTEINNVGVLRERAAQLSAVLSDLSAVRWVQDDPLAGWPLCKSVATRALVAVLERRGRLVQSDLAAAEDRLTSMAARLPQAKLPLDDARRSLAELDQLESGIVSDLADMRRGSPFDLGQAMVFDGVLRRVTKVRVSDDELRQRFGLDHYFQLDVFVNTGAPAAIDKTPGAKSVETWPVFFWTPSVPPGWETWVDKDVRQKVRIAGVYFRLFEYESTFAVENSRIGKQWGPILIGPGVYWRPPAEEDNSLYAMIAGGLFAAAVLLAWLGLWRFRRGDRRFRRQTIERQREPEAGKSLNELLRDVESRGD